MNRTDFQLISDPPRAVSAIDALSASPTLGLDTEFVRDRTWFPRPGLLQISGGERVWLFDLVALAGNDSFRTALAGLLNDPGTVKILHSVGEDLEVLDRIAGTLPEPLFDTQRAAAMLGWPLQIRYESLAGELLGIEFAGGLARNDWCKRPLPEAWLSYAADDVIGLPAMHEILRGRLEAKGRLAWLEEDCARLIASTGTQPPPLHRIRGAAGLDDTALERLNRLAEWRDAEARRRDLPRGFVVRDETLLALARAGRAALAGDEPVPMPPKRFVGRIERLLAAPPDLDFRRAPELQPLEPAQRDEIKQLQQRVKQVAAELGLEPAVIASRRELTRLVRGARCDWLSGWRGELLPALREQRADRA